MSDIITVSENEIRLDFALGVDSSYVTPLLADHVRDAADALLENIVGRFDFAVPDGDPLAVVDIASASVKAVQPSSLLLLA
jgi:hypothetical protein